MGDPTPPGVGIDVALDALRDVYDRLVELSAPSGTQRTQAVKRLGEAVDAVPVHVADGVVATGFAVAGSSSWKKLGTVRIDVPLGRTRAVLLARASISVTFPRENPYDGFELRAVVGGHAGHPVGLSYAAHESQIVMAASAFSYAEVPLDGNESVVTATVEMRRVWDTGSPSDNRNEAGLSVSAVFTQ